MHTHLPAWHNGRMIVIGDAAHAPSPTSGQGASLSVEDAVVLAKCLRDLPSPQAAFTRSTAGVLGGQKNSRALLSGSRNDTPGP
ncbi:MAG TPA: FAD-dependent monooxygenase [Jiangellaceae bacterium]|nr:FAD-dependent monooxygenase [Jiangellaceae bacterium]